MISKCTNSQMNDLTYTGGTGGAGYRGKGFTVHWGGPVNGTRPIKAPVTRMAIFQPGLFYLENYWVS